jgi:hypothetical protein
MDHNITPADLPALFTDCDQNAIIARRDYFRLLWTSLFFTAAPEVIDALKKLPWPWHTQSQDHDSQSQATFIVTCITVAVAVISTVVLFTQRLDKKWFLYRSTAEEVLNMAWLYMMQCPPFDGTSDDDDNLFLDRLNALIEARAENITLISSQATTSSQITQLMRSIRSSTCADRTAFYIHNRINDQIFYHQAKAKTSLKKGRMWFLSILLFQALTFTAVVLQALAGEHYDFVGITIAGGVFCIGWMQANKFGETSLACAATAQQLSILSAKSSRIQEPKQLHVLVEETERILRDEHKAFLARGAG